MSGQYAKGAGDRIKELQAEGKQLYLADEDGKVILFFDASMVVVLGNTIVLPHIIQLKLEDPT